MRDIKGYEGLYAVTEDGKVWSYKRKKFLKPIKSKGGYLSAHLYKEGKQKTCRIHRLVMETYCPIKNMEQMHVDHIDFNTENNCLENLRWLSPTENQKRQKKAKEVRCIETKKVFSSTGEAERQTGVNQSNISKACRRKIKSAGGFHWVYEEDFQDMLTAELLEKVFCGDEESETDGADMVSVCGQSLNEYLQTKNN